MKFISTRGNAPAVSFSDALLQGLAPDGGLYLPEVWPQVSREEIESFATMEYAAIATSVLSRLMVDDALPQGDALSEMIAQSYAGFNHPATTPLVEMAPGQYVLELFHGPTLSFKDVAMQLLGRLMDYALTQRGQSATIVGATSGDTGSAAIEAFRGREHIDIFIMHPEGRTSAIQRQQMTTVTDPNVHNLAIKGTFDDCQGLLKAMFANTGFRDRVRLSGVNSINFGRIAAQIVYYFKAAAQLGAPHRKVTFVVPTGNFGDIFAGFAAKSMGLPIERLVIATNQNDILRRALETGRYETREVIQTTSPSMDIQVSSNFERLLYEASGRDGAGTARLLQSLTQSGGFDIPANDLSTIRTAFSAATTSDAEAATTIADTLARTGYLLDPHTATGVHAAASVGGTAPIVTLATAHPAKFPEAVHAASGIEPPLPLWLADLSARPERFSVLPNESGEVEAFIRARTRVVEEAP